MKAPITLILRAAARRVLALAAVLSLAAAGAVAQTPANQTPANQTPAAPAAGASYSSADEDVIVHSARKGPQMWYASKNGHEIWILGLQRPIPKGLKWDDSDVEKVIAKSDVVLQTRFNLDFDIGPFKAIGLLLKARKLSKNGDKGTLKSVLPPDLYARFSALRQQYGAGPDEWERLRPVPAVLSLTGKAFDRNKLEGDDRLWEQTLKIAKKHKITLDQVKIKPDVKAKVLLDKLAALPESDEISCFAETLVGLEKDLPKTRQKAFAWAAGDLRTLRALSRENKTETACGDPVLAIPEFRKLREEGDAQVYQHLWAAAAKYDHVFLLTDLSSVVAAQNNLLDRLRGQGFTIEGP